MVVRAAAASAPASPSVPLEPGVEVAAVGERAALDDAALVEPVEEEAGPRLGPLGLVEDRAARRRCRPSARRGAGRCSRRRGSSTTPSMSAGNQAPCGSSESCGRLLLVDADELEQLGVPAAAGPRSSRPLPRASERLAVGRAPSSSA